MIALIRGRDCSTCQAHALEEAEANFRSRNKILEEELERQKTTLRELTQHYSREQEIMLSVIHGGEMQRLRQHVGSAPPSKPTPTAWLPMLRSTVSRYY